MSVVVPTGVWPFFKLKMVKESNQSLFQKSSILTFLFTLVSFVITQHAQLFVLLYN